MKIPEDYQQIMPYLIVQNASGLIDFLHKTFGGLVKMKIMRDNTLIMHAEVTIGSGLVMLADATEDFNPQPAGMFIFVPDVDISYELALRAGAVVVMPPSMQTYGRSGGVQDPWGNTWWITTPL